MQRTKIESYIYDVVQRRADGQFITLGQLESAKPIRSEKAKKEAILNAGFAYDKSMNLVWIDTETQCYEMSDEDFYKYATPVNKTENEK